MTAAIHEQRSSQMDVVPYPLSVVFIDPNGPLDHPVRRVKVWLDSLDL